MIRLPNTGTYSLELVTAQNGASVTVCYSDATTNTYPGSIQVTSVTSATTSTICSTPAASTVRDIDFINIKNTFAGSHTMSLQIDANGTNYPMFSVVLLTDESLNFTHGSGWQCKDANGNTKTTPLTAMTSAQLAAIVSDETGSGALVFATSPTLVTPALGTPGSGDLRNCSLAVAPAIGGTTPNTGAFTTLSATGSIHTFGNDSVATEFDAPGDVFKFVVDSNNNTGGTPNFQWYKYLTQLMSLNASSLTVPSAILSSGATSGVGYTAGAGGTVTQITSRTTGVTINKINGEITLVSAAGSASWQSMTVTNSAMAATDHVVPTQKSGTDKYLIHVTAKAAGSFELTYATTGGTTTEQPVFGFEIHKGSAA